MARNHDLPGRPRELAEEQSLSELEQAIGDREQLVGDRDQSPIDGEHLSEDDERRQDTRRGVAEELVLDTAEHGSTAMRR